MTAPAAVQRRVSGGQPAAAIQVDQYNAPGIARWLSEHGHSDFRVEGFGLDVRILLPGGGLVAAGYGDWIVLQDNAITVYPHAAPGADRWLNQEER